MSAPSDNKQAGAFAIRSPLARWRPWVSDGVWIAHESHVLFGKLSALMPRNGWWKLGPGGAEIVPDKTSPDLASMMVAVGASLGHCVVERGEYERSESVEAAAEIAGSRLVEAVGDDGQLWLFDQDIIEAADHRHEWEWRLAPDPTRGTAVVAHLLIGVDRKGRARFALMPRKPDEFPDVYAEAAS